MPDADPLLVKYRPLLVVLPQDPARYRPWSRWWQRPAGPRGDYHPCSAEFFLGFVLLREEPKSWMAGETNAGEDGPTGLDQLRRIVESASPDQTVDWEIDLAPIRSQDAVQAWPAYATMLREAGPFRPVVYGRKVAQGGRTCLQYWFLYVYNDAPNKHEGDWEMVTLELSPEGVPVQAGYAGHASGFRRPWSAVKTVGARPVVYVARGSHAAYFEHRPRGQRANSLVAPKGFPGALDFIWVMFSRAFQDLVFFLRLNDRTASGPGDAVTDASNVGDVLEPTLVAFPGLDAAGRGEFWWMRLKCRWGSRHARLFGTIAPLPPWVRGDKWERPCEWIDQLPEDPIRR